MSIRSAHAMSLSVVVAQQSVAAGDTFVADWYLDTEGRSINVIDGALYFSPDTLDLQSTITGSSVVSLWIEQPHLVEPGVIRFVGGVPAGVRGSKVPLFQTVFRATHVGTSTIALGPKSIVVLSDGAATKTPITMQPVVFGVLPAAARIVSSPSHPVQTQWYTKARVVFRVREKNPLVYSLSTNPDVIPTGEPGVVSQDIVYEDLRDGIYYFKVALVHGTQQQELQTYRVQIDRTAPTVTDAVIDAHSELYGSRASLNFYASDKESGVARTRVKTGWFGFYHSATSPYKLHRPLLGNVVHLKVTDHAGNTSVSTYYYRGYLANWVSICVTLCILLCALYYIVRVRHHLFHFFARVRTRLFSSSRSFLQ